MEDYELTYLVDPESGRDQAEDISKRINDFIQKAGGTIGKTEPPAKRALRYLIKKRANAFLVSVDFSLDKNIVKELGELLKKEGRILRILLVKRERPKREPRVRTARPLVQELTEPKDQKSEKVELGKIEEKLKEILGE
ncbi:MAG: 30S ribosomal protein S6 [Candidatus Nealsonbacteria bacterium]|nr:30S ribosomal protein S6 [Candidatus Nealsonbacteria bacterium]